MNSQRLKSYQHSVESSCSLTCSTSINHSFFLHQQSLVGSIYQPQPLKQPVVATACVTISKAAVFLHGPLFFWHGNLTDRAKKKEKKNEATENKTLIASSV